MEGPELENMSMKQIKSLLTTNIEAVLFYRWWLSFEVVSLREEHEANNKEYEEVMKYMSNISNELTDEHRRILNKGFDTGREYNKLLRRLEELDKILHEHAKRIHERTRV